METINDQRKVLELLVLADNLLADRKHWTHHTNARNIWRHRVRYNHPSAVAWCLNGALLVVWRPLEYKQVDILNSAAGELAHTIKSGRTTAWPWRVLTDANDSTDFRTIKRYLLETIGRLTIDLAFAQAEVNRETTT